MTKALDQKLNEAADLASKAAPLLDDFVNGDEDTVIHGRAGDYPCQAKAAKDTRTTITTMVSDTLGEITDHAALVTNEADRSKTEADRAASEATQAGSDADRADTAAGKAEIEAGKAKQSATDAASTAQHFVDQTVPEAESGLSQSAAGYIAAIKAEADKAIGQADRADAAATKAEAQAATATAQAGAATDSAGLAEAAATQSGESAVTSKSEADRSKLEADRAKAAADSVPDMPDQEGKAGKFLGTDGTAYSWKDVPPELPAMTGQGGKLLGTDGSKPAWRDPPVALPDQAGHDSEFLCTDGTTADWQPIPEGLPPQSGNDGKFLQTDGATAEWATISDSLPVGFIGSWPGKSAPMGWLWIEPITIYNRVDYPALYKHMQDNCPHLIIDGDTFKLCDSRGRGVIGYDPTGVIDPDNVGRELLTEQDDATRKLYGHIDSGVWYGSDPSFTMDGVFNTAGWKKINTKVDSAASATGKLIFDSSREVPTASVNRINNFNALWIIKAYDSVLEPEQLQAKAVIDQVNANAAELVNVKDITNKMGHVLIDFGPVNKNSSYVKPNPFGDKPVILKTELRIEGKWSESGHYNNYSNGNGRFTEGRTLGTNIHVVTGNEAVLDDVQGRSGSAFNGRYLTTCNCRVHVLRVGV